MIKEYKPKKKIKPKKRRLLKLAVVFSVLIGIAVWYYFGRIAPVVFTIVEERTLMLISEAIDLSASEHLSGMDYDDYVIMRTGEDGTLTYLGINSVGINKFSRDVTETIRGKMKVFESNGVEIPFGSFTGVAFLSSVGPEVQLHALTLATVDIAYLSSFESGGINQTLHRLYISIDVVGEIVLPGRTQKVTNSSQILVSESIIVGKTPNTYLDF